MPSSADLEWPVPPDPQRGGAETAPVGRADGVPGSSGQLSPDGRWWWDGTGWFPVRAPAPPGVPLVRYSPDGSWWWDGREWRPTVAPRPPDPPGSTIVHVALALGLVLAAVSAPLMMIGIADSRSSSSFAPGLAELLFALVVASPPVVLGAVALVRLPATDPRRGEAVVAILLGLGVALFLLFLIFA